MATNCGYFYIILSIINKCSTLRRRPEVPIHINTWFSNGDDVFSISTKVSRDCHLNSISKHKIHYRASKYRRAIPFLGTFPKLSGNQIEVTINRKPTHTDKYLDFHSNYPISDKNALVGYNHTFKVVTIHPLGGKCRYK